MSGIFQLLNRGARWWVCAAALGLAACGGGGGGDGTAPAEDCSVSAQKDWLRDYMNEWYFWYRMSPSPAPGSYASVRDYFSALLYTGSDPAFPPDRYSGSEATASFNSFYRDGETLGYGLSVAGIEVTARPDLPLKVRYVEPRSDAAARGVQRGDQVLSINGRSAADIIASNDYSALSPRNPGDTITLQLRGSTGERSAIVTASVYALTPVSGATVLTSPGGKRMGYVVVKDMISQASPGLQAAFAQFRAQGVTELVLDLRYNGGGLVSMAAEVASYAAGAQASGRTFAALLYNDKRAPFNNDTFRFNTPPSALEMRRVFVLIGPRTCSASEQVINGLRGVGVDVVAIGGTSCGKPVGFLPSSQCGTTYSAVNFESVNARNEGRYFDGFAATCPVADDLSRPLGSAQEGLLAAAQQFADRGVCAATAGDHEAPQARRAAGGWAGEPQERRGMIPR